MHRQIGCSLPKHACFPIPPRLAHRKFGGAERSYQLLPRPMIVSK
jgi:hypothetical protein